MMSEEAEGDLPLDLGPTIALAELPVLEVGTLPSPAKPNEDASTLATDTPTGAVPMFSTATVPPPGPAPPTVSTEGATVPMFNVQPNPGAAMPPPPVQAPVPTQPISGMPPPLVPQPATVTNPTQATPTQTGNIPIAMHQWFYCHHSGKWSPFSIIDSSKIDHGIEEGIKTTELLTDGGRYSVNLQSKERKPVYWNAAPNKMRRGLWFVGQADTMYPLKEESSDLLEQQYRSAYSTGKWNQRVDLPDGEAAQLVAPNFFVFYTEEEAKKQENRVPKSLRRGFWEEIHQGTRMDKIPDHCVLVLPSICMSLPRLSDLGFLHAGDAKASFADCVDAMGGVSQDVVKAHFEVSTSSQSSGFIDFIPIVCDEFLETTENSKKIEGVLQSANSNLRRFLSEAMLDSITYGANMQTLMDATAAQITKVAKLYCERNPSFTGNFQLAGVGFGGCLLYDLLANQHKARENANVEEDEDEEEEEQSLSKDSKMDESDDDEADEERPQPPVEDGDVTVESLLTELGYEEFIEALNNEDVDLQALKECSDTDFKELGINLGKRKKIMAALHSMEQKKKEKEEQNIKDWEKRVAEKRQKRAEERLEKRRKAAEAAEKAARKAEKQLSKTKVSGGTQGGKLKVPFLDVKIRTLFLLGCPKGVMECFNGQESQTIAFDKRLVSSDGVLIRVLNIFNPYDPLASRLEPLIDANARGANPVEVPHHMGRKRLHLEFKDYLREASKDFKNEVKKLASQAWTTIKTKIAQDGGEEIKPIQESQPPPETNGSETKEPAIIKYNLPQESLNAGGRVDHVLQEDPLEILTEKFMSLKTHNSYWTSRDVLLFMLNSMYGLRATEE
eukprot:m.82136 g.82136  ORF g.82136 m.82136 type:complete len:843 (+) comp12855_c0_seq1:26-2554(+)